MIIDFGGATSGLLQGVEQPCLELLLDVVQHGLQHVPLLYTNHPFNHYDYYYWNEGREGVLMNSSAV